MSLRSYLGFICLVLLAPALLAPPVLAHESGILALRLNPDADSLTVEVDIADLDFILGLRDPGSTTITWAGVQRQESAIKSYLTERLNISGCELQAPNRGLGLRPTAQARLVINFDLACGEKTDSLTIGSRVLDELPGYRSVLHVEHDSTERLHMLAGGEITIDRTNQSRHPGFLSFVAEGIDHILHGTDHLVFLLLLVLPLAGQCTIRNRCRRAAVIVTAFTVSHSITLSLSVLGNLSLPSGPVELLIAGSVVLVAIMNLTGRIEGTSWPIAYAFGLIHGFGFAGAFAELADGGDLAWDSLLGFNLGVEIGQIAVVAVALLLLGLLKRKTVFQRLVPAGSAAAGFVGLIWIVERI